MKEYDIKAWYAVYHIYLKSLYEIIDPIDVSYNEFVKIAFKHSSGYITNYT